PPAGPASPGRALVPVHLAVPSARTLRFRLSVEPFVRDPRFRLVSLLPADPATMHRCADWSLTVAIPPGY
ncbi:MAG: hypothetical protein M3Q10_19860, partial [Chloroflexota bacterium]|nr:hypothetical protein [Chloroflexota bacterium]